MPWPNLTPQELAAYQMLSGGNPQMGQAQQMTPQMQAMMAMVAQQQSPMTGQMNPGMGQPTMANMLAARPNSSGGMINLPTTPGFTPSGGNNMSTILNNPHLLQLLMSQYGGGAT